MKELQDLVDISNQFGRDKNYVIAGGGNTSYKNQHHIWVKASGTSMATLTEKQLVRLDRKKLQEIPTMNFSDDVNARELEVKDALAEAVVDEGRGLRPSVETSMHECIRFPYIVHTHPHLVNALLCGRNSKKLVEELFGNEVLYIPYTDPGYTLFMEVDKQLGQFREKYASEPTIIFLENHGVFVGADTPDEIRDIYTEMMQKIEVRLEKKLPESAPIPIDEKARKILPALRMMFSEDSIKILKIKNNALIQHFAEKHDHYRKISLPFTPDIIVYCKAKYLYIESAGTADAIIERVKSQLERFVKEYGYPPKVILVKDLGLITIEDTSQSAQTVLDIYEDLMKISYQSESFGGPRFLTPDQIAFIDNWEVENYRRNVARKGGSADTHLINQKIVMVTGGAQGFGEGIVESVFRDGANVVIADINEEKGRQVEEELNSPDRKNEVVFVKTDVSDPNSVAHAVLQAACAFGGLDVFISNAGVLRAGGLDEMDPETFDFMTDVNYKGYFLCVKFASEIMKIQQEYKSSYVTDIIQINSKSGLKGSNRNFAYAGGKFGGIGLTQSFALELVNHRIKVNSICPGNFFEGPLWSDPQKGLFVQYLDAGKVHGAKNIEDVKKHYESQVPLKRGCRVEDVLKAIYYVIDQQYETGQAIPVTGGQIMLS